MSGRVGIHDVASAAGVSPTTVSHALNGRGKVSPETRSRVRRIADELGYAPNRVATALRSRRTGILGFVSDEIATTPFAGRIVLGAQEAAAEHGLILMVVNSGGDAGVERRQIASLLAQQVDALIYATMFHRTVRVPDAGRVPVVLANAEDLASSTPSIVPDEHATAVTATRLLLDAGHRSIVHLTLAQPGRAVDGRIEGYRDTMGRAGLPARVVRVPPPADAAAGRHALREAYGSGADLTAVFAFNDPMAMGVYQAAAERSLVIPDDLSVVGVDDFEVIAAQLRPALTTVGLPHDAMGRWVVEEAVRRIAGADGPPQRLRVQGPLVVRRSTAVRDASPLSR